MLRRYEGLSFKKEIAKMSEKITYHWSQIQINFNLKKLKSTNKTEINLLNYLICVNFQRKNNNLETYTFL